MLSHHRRLSAKTELAAALAHQIRTPLAAAMLHTANLSSRRSDQCGEKRVADRALDAMRQLERLVEDMLTFARGGQLDVDGFSLAHLLEGLASNVAANASDSEFKFELAGEIPDVQLVGNTEALLSMMLNLINNARTATNGTGCLRTTVKLAAARVSISFEDNGPGIPPHASAEVFEPFYTTTTSGTGLGLAVARSIARAHGGELELDSDFECGARFVLSLPLPDQRPNVFAATEYNYAGSEQRQAVSAI